MKKLENKKTTLLTGKDDGKHDYASLIALCANSVPKDGVRPELMESRLRVLRAVKSVKGKDIQLEDADAKCAKEAVEAMTWGAIHEDIGTFIADVKAAF